MQGDGSKKIRGYGSKREDIRVRIKSLGGAGVICCFLLQKNKEGYWSKREGMRVSIKSLGSIGVIC